MKIAIHDDAAHDISISVADIDPAHGQSGARHPPYVLNVPRGGRLCEALRSPNARGRSIFGRGKRGERSIVPGALRRRLERLIRMHAKRKSGAEQQ